MADRVLNVISTQGYLEVQASHARVAPPILPTTGFPFGFKITVKPCTELLPTTGFLWCPNNFLILHRTSWTIEDHFPEEQTQ